MGVILKHLIALQQSLWKNLLLLVPKIVTKYWPDHETVVWLKLRKGYLTWLTIHEINALFSPAAVEPPFPCSCFPFSPFLKCMIFTVVYRNY